MRLIARLKTYYRPTKDLCCRLCTANITGRSGRSQQNLPFHDPSQFLRRLSTRNTYDPNIVYKEIDNVVTIGINRPMKKNAVNRETALQLADAFKRFENTAEARVAVLHGIGGNFCSGYDLSEISVTDKSLSSEDFKRRFQESSGPMGGTYLQLRKPVIASISGYAVAGGLELALFCTMRVAEEDSIFGVFCRKHGVPLIDGGTFRLPKLIGLSRAMDLILTGRSVDANEALLFGLINRIVPKGQGFEAALSLAKSIAKLPQECMINDLASAYYASYQAKSIKDALQNELENGVMVIQKESVVGAKKFLGKNNK